MLVEEVTARAEGDAEGLVLRVVPADGGQHHEPPLGEQIERSELAREQQRVAERRDDRACDEPQARRCRSDAREQHERAGPGRRGILVPRQRVLAGVRHQTGLAGARAEHDVLRDHDGVDPGVLRLDRDADERPQVAGRGERPVLAEHEDELDGGLRGHHEHSIPHRLPT